MSRVSFLIMAQCRKALPNTQRQQDIQHVVGTLEKWILQGRLEKINIFKEVADIFQLSVATVKK